VIENNIVRDLARMKQLKIDFVRIGEFAWLQMELKSENLLQ